MNKLLGYFLMGVGVVGLIFFLNYKGTAIPLRELWFALSIFIIITGGYFFAKYKWRQFNELHSAGPNKSRLAEIEQLKLTGDKVKVTLDNAEVKSRTYQQQIIKDGLPSRMEVIDALYDSGRNYKTEEIQQTYIVFYKQYNGTTYKFISPATTQSVEVVRQYIDRQKGVDLYVGPQNPSNHYFELPFV